MSFHFWVPVQTPDKLISSQDVLFFVTYCFFMMQHFFSGCSPKFLIIFCPYLNSFQFLKIFCFFLTPVSHNLLFLLHPCFSCSLVSQALLFLMNSCFSRTPLKTSFFSWPPVSQDLLFLLNCFSSHPVCHDLLFLLTSFFSYSFGLLSFCFFVLLFPFLPVSFLTFFAFPPVYLQFVYLPVSITVDSCPIALIFPCPPFVFHLPSYFLTILLPCHLI